MKSKNIVFIKENQAELITEDVRMPNRGEILVKLFRLFSSIGGCLNEKN